MASKLGHDFVCTEHLLLGLLGTDGACSREVLLTFGVDYLDTLNQANKLSGSEDCFPVKVPFSKFIAPIFTRAEQLSLESNDTYTSTKHLLIGLVDDALERTDVARVGFIFQYLEIDMKKLRVEALLSVCNESPYQGGRFIISGF
ncbi:MAG: hypothetical protein IAF58_08395 [Leptolyngbya sp.]|nr:hypothetical protein [Candidatus Melainabacteria bacterium]